MTLIIVFFVYLYSLFFCHFSNRLLQATGITYLLLLQSQIVFPLILQLEYVVLVLVLPF